MDQAGLVVVLGWNLESTNTPVHMQNHAEKGKVQFNWH